MWHQKSVMWSIPKYTTLHLFTHNVIIVSESNSLICSYLYKDKNTHSPLTYFPIWFITVSGNVLSGGIYFVTQWLNIPITPMFSVQIACYRGYPLGVSFQWEPLCVEEGHLHSAQHHCGQALDRPGKVINPIVGKVKDNVTFLLWQSIMYWFTKYSFFLNQFIVGLGIEKQFT